MHQKANVKQRLRAQILLMLVSPDSGGAAAMEVGRVDEQNHLKMMSMQQLSQITRDRIA